MTKQEIKALVAAKIEGQGSMVDVGGVLPTIINEIIDLIPEPQPTPEVQTTFTGTISMGEIIVDATGKPTPKPGDIVEIGDGQRFVIIYIESEDTGQVAYSNGDDVWTVYPVIFSSE